jgi:pimeloyl-ACP methyl ester carboxylesterase
MNIIEAHQDGVYALVRGAARVSATAAGQALHRKATPEAPSVREDPTWAPYVAAAGAAFGDRLDPALTTAMGLRRDGISITPADLPASPSLIVFVHGLGATELQWSRDYLYVGPHALVRYNSGLPIADNAADLAALLEQVVEQAKVQRLVIVGHSMGGLVARGAIAQSIGSRWVEVLTDLITLGSPHSGAPLERVAARALAFGQSFKSAEAIIRLGQRRSQGVKDLRFGAMSHGDWKGEVDMEFVDSTALIALPDHIRHRAVVAYLAPVIGDGIVPQHSARHPGAQVKMIPGDHLSLLREPLVRDLLAEVGASPAM